MVYSKFNQHTGILDSKFAGDVTLTEIVNYIRATKENKAYPRLLKIKTDAREANFIFSIDDLEIIIEENEKSLEKYDAIIDAIIIASPNTTAISVLYKELAKNDKYEFEIFSTDNGASEWLETQKK